MEAQRQLLAHIRALRTALAAKLRRGPPTASAMLPRPRRPIGADEADRLIVLSRLNLHHSLAQDHPLVFSPDSGTLAVGGTRGSKAVWLWDVAAAAVRVLTASDIFARDRGPIAIDPEMVPRARCVAFCGGGE